MKILHYINNLGSGGAEKLLTDVLPLMRDKGHEVYLVISNPVANVAKYESIFQQNNIDVINLNLSFYNPLQIFKIFKIVNSLNIDVVHAHLFPTQYLLAFASFLFKKRIKLVKTEHNIHNNRRNKKINKIIEKIVYKQYDLVIAITEEIKINLVNWLGSNINIVTIQNGVNLEQIEREKQKDTDVIFSDKNFNILMVGRFDNRAKDQMTLIKALAFLPINTNIYFAGEGPYLDNVKEQTVKMNYLQQVHFLGLRTDVYALMNKVDINILSSNYEGLSGVTLESLASGKPFLGSAVQGIQNIVPDERFLFPKGDPEKLAQSITKLMDTPKLYQQMIDDSKEFIKQYDIKIMVDKYLKAYEKIM